MLKTITLRGKDIDVRELTIAQLDEVLGQAGGLTTIDRTFNPEMVSEHMLVLATGLGVDELRACRPSELRPLVEAVREVNADFLAGVRSLVSAG